MPKLILEIEVSDFNAEGMEQDVNDEYSAWDYLLDIGSSAEVALGWTAPEADNRKTIVALNGMIRGARLQ